MSHKYMKKYDPYLICCLEQRSPPCGRDFKILEWDQGKILAFRILKKKYLTFNLTLYDMNEYNHNKVIKVHIVTVTNGTPLCMTECKLLALNSVLCIGSTNNFLKTLHVKDTQVEYEKKYLE